MNQIEIPKLTLSPVLTKKETDNLRGRYATDNDYKILINDDCDAYTDDGEPLFFFRKGKIPKKVCETAFYNLRAAATKTENRGTAAGPLDSDDQIGHKTISTHRYREIKQDGTLSKVMRAKKVNSGIAGYFDRNTRFPYCRQTSFTEKNKDAFSKSIPFLKFISHMFEEACPERYQAQKKVVDQSSKDFIITDTVFSTVTVNKNFQTAYHTDAGDLKEGLGNLAVLSAGKYQGGYTVMPRYDCAFDLSSGDVCYFDVHQVHGNTKMDSKTPYERVSIVCYYRENIKYCKTMEEELERAKKRKEGDKIN